MHNTAQQFAAYSCRMPASSRRCGQRYTFVKALSFIFIAIFSLRAIAEDITPLTNESTLWSITSPANESRWVEIHNLSQGRSSHIYFIQVLSLKKGQKAWQIKSLAPHLAITEAALLKSVIKPRQSGSMYPESFENAHEEWLMQSNGKGGSICSTTVTDCLPK